MNNKNLLLIVNPKSGKAKMKNELLGVVGTFCEAGYCVCTYTTAARCDATDRILKIDKDNKPDLIVVCGGDGTLNEVITGLMKAGLDIPIGYIPSGTLNEWSSGLGISRNIQKAAKDIVSGREIKLDIGRFSDKYFSYTASFGAFTDASYSAPQEVKNVLGQAAYFFQGIKSLGNIKPIHLKISCEEKELDGEYLFGAVSNSMSVGGIVKFSDTVVKLNDGEFEVVLIKKPDNILKLQPVIDGILKRDLNREGIEFFHTKRLTVTESETVSWTLDGEYAPGAQTIEIENMHLAIRLIVPGSAGELKNIKE